jgi:hypothetical protein
MRNGLRRPVVKRADLVLLGKVLTPDEQGEKGVLVLGNRPFPTQLDQLTQRIAPERRPKALIYKFDEFGPRQLAVVAFA